MAINLFIISSVMQSLYIRNHVLSIDGYRKVVENSYYGDVSNIGSFGIDELLHVYFAR